MTSPQPKYNSGHKMILGSGSGLGGTGLGGTGLGMMPGLDLRKQK